MELRDFLLYRIAEDEAVAERCVSRNAFGEITGWHPYGHQIDAATLPRGAVAVPAPRFLAECDAKRRIVEAESRSRRTKANVSAEMHKAPDDRVTVRWLDERDHSQLENMSTGEYLERFTEPSPPSATLRLLALSYADHPDYRQEWRP